MVLGFRALGLMNWVGLGVWDAALRIWGFPNKGGYHFGIPIVRTIIYWGLYWGSPILGNYHLRYWV